MRKLGFSFFCVGALALQMGCDGSDDSADAGVLPDESSATQTAGAPEPLEGSMTTPTAVTEYAETDPSDTAHSDATDKMEELLQAELGGDPAAALDRTPTDPTLGASEAARSSDAGSSQTLQTAAPPVDTMPAPRSSSAPAPSNASTLLQRAEAYAQENKDYKVVTTLRRVDDAQLSAAERERKTTLYRAASDKLASSEKGLAD